MLRALLFLFLLPLASHGLWWMSREHADSWRTADWSSSGLLNAEINNQNASIIIFAAPTGRWKGIFSLHSWIAIKDKGSGRYRRYDVVGWGQPVHVDEHAADARWYGNTPTIVARVDGAEAERLIPKLRAAIKAYPYAQRGDYRIWPGPNSNTFVANLLAAVPEANIALPSNAIGRDWRGWIYVGPSPTRTGLQISLMGLFGVTVAWTEGIEVNFLGLVSGIAWSRPSIKLPGWGELSFR